MNIQDINRKLNQESELVWQFSDDWLSSLLKICKFDFSKKNILSKHKLLFNRLGNELNHTYKHKWANIDSFRIQDIVSEEMFTRLRMPNGSKVVFTPSYESKEKTYLEICIESKLKNTHVKKTKNIKVPLDEINSKETAVYQKDIDDLKFIDRVRDLESTKTLLNLVKNLSLSSQKSIREIGLKKFDAVLNPIVRQSVFYGQLNNEFDFLKANEIPFLFKYTKIIKLKDRRAMFLARDLVAQSKEKFLKEKIRPLINEQEVGKANDKLRKTPVLSAVALNKYGDVIKTAFKGQQGQFKHHCEFTLFEGVFEDVDWSQIIDGKVFVTLEPCHKRGKWQDDNGSWHPKIPCAVRCVESGISSICIATHDPDEDVRGAGIETLKTGIYRFKKLNNRELDSTGFGDDEGDELRGVDLLCKYFKDKGYRIISDTQDELVFQIGKPIEVSYFHTDVAVDIMKINREFLQSKFGTAFGGAKW